MRLWVACVGRGDGVCHRGGSVVVVVVGAVGVGVALELAQQVCRVAGPAGGGALPLAGVVWLRVLSLCVLSAWLHVLSPRCLLLPHFPHQFFYGSHFKKKIEGVVELGEKVMDGAVWGGGKKGVSLRVI